MSALGTLLPGVTRKYWPEIDAPVKAACAALTRSVAEEHKQGIKSTLKYLGWKGFKMVGSGVKTKQNINKPKTETGNRS